MQTRVRFRRHTVKLSDCFKVSRCCLFPSLPASLWVQNTAPQSLVSCPSAHAQRSRKHPRDAACVSQRIPHHLSDLYTVPLFGIDLFLNQLIFKAGGMKQ